MYQADQFIWAILDNPDDDALRLSFADWLEAHGEEAHAEFIRLQCALAAQQQEDEQWLEWKIREEELWSVLRERWQEVFKELIPSADSLDLKDFRRGFVDRPIMLRLSNVESLEQGAGRWTFILGIQIETFFHVTAQFFASPQLRRAERLNCQRSGVTDDALQPLAMSPCLRQLKVLDLYTNYVSAAGIKALVRCPSLIGLTELYLDENKLGDAGVEALVSSPLCKNLVKLVLSRNEIGDAGIIALARSPYLESLRILLINGNKFGADGIQTLAESSSLSKLQELDTESLQGWSSECLMACRKLHDRLGDKFTTWPEYHNHDWDMV